MKTCADYVGAPSCCWCCHDDSEEFWPDYPLSQIEAPTGEIVAEVCCAVLEFAKKQEEINAKTSHQS